ncbi:MAG: nitroreductase family protein [Bacteroidales bacterium]|nr:nitroreductase family protein [Bacteroidales bacterium]
MEFKEIIARRHSVRKFTDQPVEREMIDEMIAEAMTAPSSRNTRSTGFMIVEDKSLLEAIAEMRESGSAFVKDAAAAIVVLGDAEKTDLWVDNASISTTFLMLSAVDKGLGSCWVHVNGRPRSKTDASKGMAEDYLRELLGIKDNMKVLCVLALGYESEI